MVFDRRGTTPVKRHITAPWLLVAAQLFAVTARAQDIDPEVRQVALELAAGGDALFASGNYATALERFTRASELVTAPTLMVRQAECLEKLGRLVEAAEAYRKATQFPVGDNATEPFRLAVAAANGRIAAIEARVARLEVIVKAPDPDAVLVTLNDQPLSVPQRQKALELNPGQYQVRAKAGSQSAFEAVTLEEGSRMQVTLRLFPVAVSPAVPRSRPSTMHDSRAPEPKANTSLGLTLGWISLGVGAAGILTGIGTGVEVFHLRHDLDKSGCIDTVCGPEQQRDVRTYNSLRVVSTAGFVVGGVGLAVGSALLYFAPRTERAGRKHLTPWVGIGSVGLSGGF
jgi:hypothetical protein